LATLVQRVKSFTAHQINKELGLTGRLWQPDYFDRAIRDAGHWEKTAQYIEWNPVKAGLCNDPRQWLFSSASRSKST
jgi:REP element-mobilizing transposase RayT